MWYWINGNDEVVRAKTMSASLERSLVVMQGIELYRISGDACVRVLGNAVGGVQRWSINYEQDVPERIRMYILLAGG